LTGQHAHEYPGIDDIDQSKDDTKPNSAANNQFKITYPYGEIPGIKEAGWSAEDLIDSNTQVNKLQQQIINNTYILQSQKHEQAITEEFHSELQIIYGKVRVLVNRFKTYTMYCCLA
jgi:hypothetical protein